MGASIDPFGTHGDQLTSQTLLIRHVVWRPPTQPAERERPRASSSLMKMMHGERRFARLFQRPEKLFGLFDQKMLQLVDFGQILSRFEHHFHLIGLRPKAQLFPSEWARGIFN
jgi:hypothetical protein